MSVDNLDVQYFDSVIESELPPVFLIPGTGGSSEEQFWALFPMLAANRRVIALNLADDEQKCSIDRYSNQVQKVLEATGISEPIVLVGYSLGAVIAASFAAENPSLLAGLVLVAGWARTSNFQKLRNSAWLSIQKENPASLAPLMTMLNFSNRYLDARTPLEIETLNKNVKISEQRVSQMRLNADIDITETLSTISVPSFVIACVHDLIAPKSQSRYLFAAIQDCRYAELESGHAVVTERPAELFAYIDEFSSSPNAHPAGSRLTHPQP